jgi:hypothetical protein
MLMVNLKLCDLDGDGNNEVIPPSITTFIYNLSFLMLFSSLLGPRELRSRCTRYTDKFFPANSTLNQI